MGREIRKIKKGWQHPKDETGKYHPMYDGYYLDALNKWWKNHLLWLEKKHPNQLIYKYDNAFFAEYGGNPPDIEEYRKEQWDEKNDEMWFQLYETVSEGTPLSPAFQTKDELVEYLIKNGDFWNGKWTREQAYKFMDAAWCCSMIMSNGSLYSNQEQMNI